MPRRAKTLYKKTARKGLHKERKKNRGLKFEVKSHVVREIWGVCFLALAILTVLSFMEHLGIVGEIWQSFLRPIFGWGFYLVPVFLGLIALCLFFAKELRFGAARVIGLILFTISVLGTIHLSVPAVDLYEVAKAGQFGGYIGFVSSFIFRSIIGVTGSYVVFLALFLISILLSFEISIGEFLASLKTEWEREKFKKEKPVRAEEPGEFRIIKSHLKTEEEEPVLTVRKVEEEGELPPEPEIEAELELSEGEKNEEEMIVKKIGEPKLAEEEFKWEFPPLDLLSNQSAEVELESELLKEKARIIQEKLGEFGIEVAMHDVHVGPTVIQYTLRPHEGVKLSKIITLKNDLALALAAKAIRIEAPIPGKSLVGIEVPNDARRIVHLKEIMESEEYQTMKSKLKLPLGRGVSGKPIVEDLSKMPHLLIAGATGTGKSVALSSFLISFLYQNSPRDLRLIIIDPKRVELVNYKGIPHLLTPVIVDSEKATMVLKWLVLEMSRRYQVCASVGHRNLDEYNADPNMTEKIPKIVVAIDELADLMMAAQKDVEIAICRIAQLARAVGIHLIIATQRPSVDVITGLIKANIPARIAFTVASSIDSRTILDCPGAEDLLGEGDMLYLSGSMSKPMRIQGVLVSTPEIKRITNRIKLTGEPVYQEDIFEREAAGLKRRGGAGAAEVVGDEFSDDELYVQALEIIKKTGRASASLFQRYLKIGYARAARLLDMLEENGVVGPARGAKPREIFIDIEGEGREETGEKEEMVE